ncbi:MAG: LacI family transcriptional regulator [Verrucomicrobiales bacterium]|nr:LacI family transcriptional regulator [Verrucomicrobiales bacterium]
MIRLKDVAERAGVSVMTVSKVLRNAPDVSAQTKTRIRRLADEMGYVPDSLAQGLRTRTTKLFGVVVSAVTNPTAAPMIMAIEERAHDLGYDLLLAHSLNDPEREESCLRKILARRVDGLFVVPVYRLAPTAPIYEDLKRKGPPVVLLGPAAPFCEPFSSVETEDQPASYTLVKHLLDLGHRRIAFFAGPPSAPWSRSRREGYHQGLREAGLKDDDNLIFTAGSTIEDGQKAALQMLNEGVHATAIQAVNDQVAIGAANILLQQGLQIPRDISVVGFGNIFLSEHFRVPLTTIGQPQYRLGLAAAEVMFELLRGGKPRTRTFPGELILRASSGPPPSKR